MDNPSNGPQAETQDIALTKTERASLRVKQLRTEQMDALIVAEMCQRQIQQIRTTAVGVPSTDPGEPVEAQGPGGGQDLCAIIDAQIVVTQVTLAALQAERVALGCP